MQKRRIALIIFMVFLSVIFATPPNIFGTEVKSPPIKEKFSREDLNQMLAPIALYPDSLLTQMLMAANYPLEIAVADRWVKENQNLKGVALDAALKNKKWHESVKLLARYPRVLSMMFEKIDWTTRLGDAYLNQKNDVMETVQGQRADAEAAVNPRPPTPPAPEAGYGPYPYPPPPPAYPPVYPVRLTPVTVSPSFPSILCDLIFLRPAGVAALGLGLAATVVAAPFALPTGSMGQVSQNLIGAPFEFTFERPLGTWQTWEVSPPGR